jgi:DNA-binding protein H-NS
MTTRYEQLISEMESLRQQAEELRAKEVAEVIAKMKRAIKVYGITAAELGFVSPAAAEEPTFDSTHRISGVPYADGHGNHWGGRGPRPKWLKALLDQGVPLEALRVNSPTGAQTNARHNGHRFAAGSLAGEAHRRSMRPVKFRNKEGQTWSGRGPRPMWLRRALSEGHSLTDFAVD